MVVATRKERPRRTELFSHGISQRKRGAWRLMTSRAAVRRCEDSFEELLQLC